MIRLAIVMTVLLLLPAAAFAATGTTIKLRGDTAANWAAKNPVLAAREPGVETDTRRLKIGDGTSHWNDLGHAGGDALPTWMPSTGPTNGRQILQATGGCSLSAYDNQADCQTNSGTWTTPTYQNTSVISGLINDTGTADDDLWSAAKIVSELGTKQNTLVAGTDYLTPATAAATYQLDLSIPDQAEAEAGTATIERAWTAQRIAQAIAALAPSGGVDEIVYLADCASIDNGFCINTTTGQPYYWNGSAVTEISGGTVDLTAPGPIGSVTPNTGAFTTLMATSFDTSSPEIGETGEIGLQEDPANGTNTITLKAAAEMATDLIFTLPNAYAGADNYALVGNGSGILTFARVLLPGEIGTTVQAFDVDLADLADGSLTGTKVDLSANTGTIYTSGSLYGRVPVIAKTASATLTNQECSGGVITNTGATGPIVLTLPAMISGMQCTILLAAAYDVDINPQDAQQILLKTNAVGDAVSSDATVGSYLKLIAVPGGWMPINGERGVWTDVN